MNDGYAICMNEWALDKSIKNELGLLLIISSLCAEKGYCYASNTYLANLFDIPTNSLSIKIKNLEEKGYINIDYEKRGCQVVSRKIRLSKFQTVGIKNFKSTILENSKENITSNNITRNNIYTLVQNDLHMGEIVQKEIELPQKLYCGKTEQQLESNFNKIWEFYPRKKGKQEAYKHYKVWLKGKKLLNTNLKLTNEQMLDAVCEYADEVKRNKLEERYIQMGSTFFNNTIIDYVELEDEHE